jgi:hypothetical protein
MFSINGYDKIKIDYWVNDDVTKYQIHKYDKNNNMIYYGDYTGLWNKRITR